jgi:hypothetical protein
MKLIDGGVQSATNTSSMVIAGTVDVAVIEQQLALRCRPEWTPIETVFED